MPKIDELKKLVEEEEDTYTTIYFDLRDDEEDKYAKMSANDALALEHKAYKEAEELLKDFATRGLDNEGHDENILMCKFTMSKDKLPELYDFISKQDSTINDGVIRLDTENFTISNFEIVDSPGMEKGIPYEDWDEYLEG